MRPKDFQVCLRFRRTSLCTRKYTFNLIKACTPTVNIIYKSVASKHILTKFVLTFLRSSHDITLSFRNINPARRSRTPIRHSVSAYSSHVLWWDAIWECINSADVRGCDSDRKCDCIYSMWVVWICVCGYCVCMHKFHCVCRASFAWACRKGQRWPPLIFLLPLLSLIPPAWHSGGIDPYSPEPVRHLLFHTHALSPTLCRSSPELLLTHTYKSTSDW